MATTELNTVNVEFELQPTTVSGEVAIPARIQGLQGEDGKSAYQLALDAGFVGSLDEWLASLKGKDGESGEDGKSGVYRGSETPPEGYDVWIDPNGEATEGLVSSVNGKTGAVELDAEDVGAMDSANLLTNSDILAIWNTY